MAAEEVTPSGYIVHHVADAPIGNPFINVPNEVLGDYKFYYSSRRAINSINYVQDSGRHMYIGSINMVESWWVDKKLHREGGAALLLKVEEGDQEFWFHNGVLDRDDGPAITTSEARAWCRNGLLHRINGPAIVFNRVVNMLLPGMKRPKRVKKLWYTNGILNRDTNDGPAVYAPEDNNHSEVFIYYNNGVITRVDGPAMREGGIDYWRLEGEFHRDPKDGPAFDPYGNEFLRPQYFVYGLEAESKEDAIGIMEGRNIKG